MKKIEAIIKGRKFTEKLFGLKKRSINRALDAAADDAEEQKEAAVMEYENLLVQLANDDVDYKETLNGMIKAQQTIHDADATIKLINKVKADLDAEVEDADNSAKEA